MTARRPRVGIKDVARVAGVSVGTVSHVLNRPERVSERRRDAVMAAIEELGYVPNHAARQLKVGSSKLVGFIFPNPLNPYYNNLAEGVQRESVRRDLNVLCGTSRGSQDDLRRYLSIFEQQRARGIIVAPTTTDFSAEIATAKRGTPVVLVSAPDPSGQLCSIAGDDRLGGQLAAEHLITTGRKRIVVVGVEGQAATDRRFAGVQDMAAKHGGVSIRLIKMPEVSVPAGVAAAQEILAAGERPDAIFACSDLVALGALQHLTVDGRFRVPSDIAIVGYDDLTFVAHSFIPLTSVRQHEMQMGLTAVGMLDDEVNNPEHTHSNVILTPELLVRESSR